MNAGSQLVGFSQCLQGFVHPVNDLWQEQLGSERCQVLDDGSRLDMVEFGIHAVKRDRADGVHEIRDVVVRQQLALRNFPSPNGFGVALSEKKEICNNCSDFELKLAKW